VLGDKVDGKGKLLREELELWLRDPVDCIKDLMQNPLFCKSMAYAPERVYTDENAQTRVYDEMWTGDWWWKIQVSSESMFLRI
jgi:Plavaka transposase